MLIIGTLIRTKNIILFPFNVNNMQKHHDLIHLLSNPYEIDDASDMGNYKKKPAVERSLVYGLAV